ncbi:MAG: hypothetical protein MJY74_08390 [Bacteroidaceae bacterium]|nr:hypothetical protein [Bacteroidaceae bacterium]
MSLVKRLTLLFCMLSVCVISVSAQSRQDKQKENDAYLAEHQRNMEKIRQDQAKRVMQRLVADADTTTVYMFASSFAFGDSVMYISSIQKMEQIQLTNKAYLLARAEFASQYARFLEENGCVAPQLSSLFFSEKKSAVLKKLEKVEKRCKKKMSFGVINVDDFEFTPVLY